MLVVGYSRKFVEDAVGLSGSITFNGSNENLSIASFSSSTPNQKILTISFWVKTTDEDAGFIESFIDDNNFLIFALSNDEVGAQEVQGGGMPVLLEVTSTSISNDEWAHIVLQVDIPNETPSDRVRIFLNGAAATPDVFEINPGSEDDTLFFENGRAINIGKSSIGSETWLDGKLADFIAVEGQLLSPGDFGFDDGGTWKWKNYEGTFGTHGFRINPQDSSEIGTDQSGNGNHFTLNNMDTSNFDSEDVPPS